MLLLMTLLGMAWAAPDALPDDDGASGPPADFPERPSYDTLLQSAIRSYQLRQRDQAIQQLAALALDEDAPHYIRQEARIYLAEDRFFQDDREGADGFFEQVVRAEPGYQIDRFRHPPDVCAQFDLVRATVLPTLLQPSLPPRLYRRPRLYHQEYGAAPWLDGGLLTAQWTLFAASSGMSAWWWLNRETHYLDTPEDRLQARNYQIVHVAVSAGWIAAATERRLRVRRDWEQKWQEYGGVTLTASGEPQVIFGVMGRF